MKDYRKKFKEVEDNYVRFGRVVCETWRKQLSMWADFESLLEEILTHNKVPPGKVAAYDRGEKDKVFVLKDFKLIEDTGKYQIYPSESDYIFKFNLMEDEEEIKRNFFRLKDRIMEALLSKCKIVRKVPKKFYKKYTFMGNDVYLLEKEVGIKSLRDFQCFFIRVEETKTERDTIFLHNYCLYYELVSYIIFADRVVIKKGAKK